MGQASGLPPPSTSGAWKQEILRLYNRVNQDLAGSGVSQQQVYLNDDHIVIVARHQRVPALSTISMVDPALGRWADAAVLDATKARLAVALHELGVDVVSVLKDYDPGVERAATVILLGSPLPGTAGS